MQTISLKLPAELHARLVMEAKSRRVTKSQVLRESLETALDANASGRQPSCFDLASDLAGSIGGLPKDLATNPKYMNDFGK